ncbi:MAG: DUF3035 domain-containing protein [Acetobacteraceae bacterium]
MRNSTYHSPVRGLLLAAGSVALLAGCSSSGLTRTFGLTRDAPDEFAVTTQAPLSMPPDFMLRPPRPGAARPQQQSERLQAEESLVPQVALTGPPTGAPSPGQSALLQETGPPVSNEIRQQVDQDARMAASSDGFLDKVLYWRKPDTQNVMVNPQAESQRLRQNAALGQSPEVGTTPTITPKKEGWFQKLFGWM